MTDFERIAKKLLQDHAGPFTAAQVEGFFTFLDGRDHPDPLGEDVIIDLQQRCGLSPLAARRVRGKWLLTLSDKGRALLADQLDRGGV
jgi:hypothetical protein